jgi:hypothetical protein
MSAKKSIGHADALWGSIDEVISTGKEATVKKFVLHRIAIIVAAIAVGSAGIATDALARGGGGGGHGGGLGGAHFGGMGGGHFGGAMGGGHLGRIGGEHFGRIGGEHFGGRAEHQHFGHHRGLGYLGDYDACWPPEQGRPRRLRYFC